MDHVVRQERAAAKFGKQLRVILGTSGIDGVTVRVELREALARLHAEEFVSVALKQTGQISSQPARIRKNKQTFAVADIVAIDRRRSSFPGRDVKPVFEIKTFLRRNLFRFSARR